MTELKFGNFVHRTSDSMSRDEVQKLRGWCEMILSFRTDLLPAFSAASEALNALANGMFVGMSSKEFWSKGFEVPHENCTALLTETFFAIYDPETSELEINMFGEDGLTIRVNAASGGVQVL